MDLPDEYQVGDLSKMTSRKVEPTPFDMQKGQPGIDFIKSFAPCAHLLHLAPNFCANKKLLKSWAQGAKVGCRGTKLFMKSTPSCVMSLKNVP